MAETRMFEVVTEQDLRELLADRPGPSVSLYQPTHRAGPDFEQDILRFKNLVNSAEERLSEHERKADACKLLAPMRALLNSGEFWRQGLDGLAMFAAPDFFRYYRLPFEMEELVVVGDAFHLTPLFEASTRGYFYILALSRSSVRLMRATRFGVEEIDLSEVDMPHSFDEAMRYDDFEKSNLQRHPTARAGATGGNRSLQHGHGPGDEDLKKEIARYFKAVDHGIGDLLRGENAPLVVAAVDYLHPLFRGATSYRNVLDRGLEGNPEQLSPAQLREQVWPVVEPYFRAALDVAKERYGNGITRGLASCELADVLASAYEGRVGALMVRRGMRRWGLFDLTEWSVDEHPEPQRGDVDLIDLAVRQTARHGGEILLVDEGDMPCDEALAAVYRF